MNPRRQANPDDQAKFPDSRRSGMLQWYDSHADEVVEQYESFQAKQVHPILFHALPARPCHVLDIGSGSGRDAAALAELGHAVVAVEPSVELQKRARQRHPHVAIRWTSDHLPKLRKIRQMGLQYDVIVLSAVWMHLPPSERRNAFRRVVSLMRPGAMLYLTLRHGPLPAERGFYDVPDEEIELLAIEHGLFQAASQTHHDILHRPRISWTHMLFRTPGDGTGALPLLRHIILNDNKSSTYKLGLLKVMVQIAQTASGLAEIKDDDTVVIPLGLFALYWLRAYRPLLESDLPQTSDNTHGAERLGFAGDAYAKLAHISPHDLRAGMRFAAENSRNLHTALRDICSTLITMPMTHTTYADGVEKVFKATRRRTRRPSGPTVLDRIYLTSFGEVEISMGLWQAARQYGAWIEPAIVAEWKALTMGYLKKQERNTNAGEITSRVESALHWHADSRTTAEIRKRAIELIDSEGFLNCVWSGKRLLATRFEIDHCFPYSAWPCGDMWNLLPATRRINQHEKRDKLPRAELLQRSEDRILSWWETAYVKKSDEWKRLFFDQANASLRLMPVSTSSAPELEDVFSSLLSQQQMLRVSQQVPLWPAKYS